MITAKTTAAQAAGTPEHQKKTMLKVMDPSMHDIASSRRLNAEDPEDEESSRLKARGVEPKIEIKRSSRF